MQNRLSILTAAAALTVAGLGFSSQSFAQDSPGSTGAGQSQSGSAGQSTGSSSSSGGLSGAANSMTARGQQSPDAKDISRTISRLCSAAVQGKFDDVAERLSAND